MGGCVTAIWGRDEQTQRAFHTRAFNPGRWKIITADGADAGMLHVEHRPSDSAAGKPPQPDPSHSP